VLKNSPLEHAFGPAMRVLFSPFLVVSHFSDRFGCRLRSEVKEPHQSFEVLDRRCQVALFAYEPYSAQPQTR